jgi:hypothetical protein
MSAGSHTKAQLDGLFKDVYADSMDTLIPDFGILTKKIPFAAAKKTGRDFVRAVKLTNEQGFTYGAGIQTLSNIISADVDDAKVRGSSMTLRTGFSYDAAANMVSSKGAFIDATKFKFMSMMEAATFRLEQQMLYGGSGLGIVSAANDGADTVTISAASWAVGTWAGQEGAEIDIYDTTGATLRVSTAIVSVNASTRVLTLTAGTDLSTVVATDVVWFKGAKGNEMVGLRAISSNTGTLYGVSGASYSLWTGNTSAVGSANLTLKKIYQGLIPAVGKGLMEDVDVYVSQATFATLANDQASLRRYNTAPTKADNGSEAISFSGANGKINVVIHPLVRESEAMAMPIGRAERIGSTDLTFNTPGKSDEMFTQIATQTGYECRLYSEQALFLPCPAKCVLFTGIDNS